MLPNFIIIGSMKCGTTSLAYYLSQHPDVFVSDPDKIDFFSKDHEFQKGLAWYESFFKGAGHATAIGEGSDDYTKGFNQKCEKAVERISQILPDCKLIFIAKHPLRHIESSWLHRYAGGREKMPFNEAVVHSPFNYLETANYKKQLQRYYDRFPGEQIQVFFTEDLAADPQKVVQSCLSFLRVDPNTESIDFNPRNVSSQKIMDRPFTQKLRNIPGLNQISKKAPPALKSALERAFTRKLTERPVWNKETLDHALDAIWAESLDFLEQHGKSRDFWDLKEYGR